MVATVSIEDLSKKLKEIFCEANRIDRKYAEIWLAGPEYNGLYFHGRINVNITLAYDVESVNDEIKYITMNYFKLLPVEYRGLIWRLIVNNASKDIHCDSDELLVYKMEEVCA